jgi:uncharacterized membrane protein
MFVNNKVAVIVLFSTILSFIQRHYRGFDKVRLCFILSIIQLSMILINDSETDIIRCVPFRGEITNHLLTACSFWQ